VGCIFSRVRFCVFGLHSSSGASGATSHALRSTALSRSTCSTMAYKHDSLEFKSSLQAIAWFWVYRLWIINGEESRHSLLFCASSEELQREPRGWKRNLQKHVTLFQNVAGRCVERIGFHRLSLHQGHPYSRPLALMIGAGVLRSPQMNVSLGSRDLYRWEHNGCAVPAQLFLAIVSEGEACVPCAGEPASCAP
jgi:hypothetical protein